MEHASAEFRRSQAVVIGINQYGNGIPQLRSAVPDATALAELLRDEHGYEVTLLRDEQASLAELTSLLTSALPALLQADDRLLLYFAGHGIALDGDDGPAGYLIPADASFDQRDTFLPMQTLHQALVALPCRHLLLILDCCFAGAFRWSATRGVAAAPQPIYRERFERFLISPAWQVLTSAGYNQEALDVSRFGRRGGEESGHSPFAQALFDALRGDADLLVRPKGCPPEGDGVITATELYCYLRDCVEDGATRQTPGIWQLHKHDKGEFIFLAPGRTPVLPPAPPLSAESNPYRGLESFDERHQELFFGRQTLAHALGLIVTAQPLTVVTGSSGSGKSSLVQAGLLPRLRASTAPAWQLQAAIRPGARPLEALAGVLPGEGALAQRVERWRAAHAEERLLLLVDQFEELVTQCRDDRQREHFLAELAEALDAHADQLRLVVTVRADFEPQFASSALQSLWGHGRFVVPPMTQDDLREAIKGPANVRVLYFEPEELVDRIINEVIQMPGALPLLSFTLSELYLRYLERRSDNRALCEDDYDALGGVAGALRNRANQEYRLLSPEQQDTMRRVMLRMVSLEGGGAARRRVRRAELSYGNREEDDRVALVIARLSAARLVVEGSEEQGGAYVEPAHDALVRGWDQLWAWIRAEYDLLPLQRRVGQAAAEWAAAERPSGLLWDDDPRLDELEQELRSRSRWLNALERDFVERSLDQQRKERRTRVAAIGAIMAILLLLAGFAFYQRGQALDSAEQRAQAQSTAEVSALEAQAAEATAVAESRVARSRQLAAQSRNELDKQPDLALLLALEAVAANDTLESQSSLMAGIQQTAGVTRFLHGHHAQISSVDYSPDGRMLATGSWDKTVILWDMASGKPLGPPLAGHTSDVTSVVFSPDGRTVASASHDRTIILWDVATRTMRGQPIQAHDGEILELAFSPRGDALASGGQDDQVRLWDPATGTLIRELPTDHRPVSALAFGPGGALLAVGGWNNTVEIWDLTSGELYAEPLQGHEGAVLSLAFSPDGRRLASGSEDQTVRVWSMLTGRLEGDPYQGHTNGVYGLDWSPNGVQLASGDDDGTIILWSPDEREPLVGKHSMSTQPIYGLAFNPVDMTLATVGWGKSIALWDLGQGLGAELPGPYDGISRVAFSGDGRVLAGAGYDGLVWLWDGATGEPLREPLEGHGNGVTALAISPDDRLLATGDLNGSIMLWDLATRKPLGEPLQQHVGVVTNLVFSHDGARLISSDSQRQLAIWDVARRQLVATRDDIEPSPQLPDAEIYGLALSPDGQELAASSGTSIYFWDLQTMQPRGEPITYSSQIYGLAYTPDGKLLASANWDRTVILWDVQTRRPAGLPIAGHAAPIYAVAISVDGTMLATGGEDQTVILWDLLRRQPIGLPLAGHRDNLNGLAFNRAGTLLASAADFDPAMYLWQFDQEAWKERACRVAHRNLTLDEWRQYMGDRPYRPVCGG